MWPIVVFREIRCFWSFCVQSRGKTQRNGKKMAHRKHGDMQKQIVVVQDTREQTPLALAEYGLSVVVEKLDFGDYSIKYPDLRGSFVIERKSLADFVACCGVERDRFERELTALRGFAHPYVVGEFGLRDILGHTYRSKINPKSVMSTIAKWAGEGINFLFCDSPQGASYIAAKLIQFRAEQSLRQAACACNILLP